MKPLIHLLRTKCVLTNLFFAFVFLFANNVFGQATVTTDLPDYSPGQTVLITGTGWQPGETVNLNIVSDCGCTNVTFPEIADANGHISNNDFLITEDHLGASFVLTATGLTSGQQAVALFTDGPNDKYTPSINPQTACAGVSQTYAFRFTNDNTATSRILSVIINIPAAAGTVTVNSAIAYSSSNVVLGNWTNESTATQLKFKSPSSATDLDAALDYLEISFTVSLSSTSTWVTSAFRNNTYSPAGAGTANRIGNDPVVTVNSAPSCSITGPNGPVCPSSSNDYTAPLSSSYLWQITAGSATIEDGEQDERTATVIAGSGCNSQFTLSLTVTDANGCSSTCTKTVNVVDNTAPVISTVPGPSTIECPATPVFANPTATDACDPNPTITHNDVTTPGTCAQEYTVTRTWTATDACGNTSTKSQTITVQDNTAPVISTVPGPSTIECPATPVFANPTATDACDPNPTITHNDVTTPGTCAQEYTVTRTWTATDACGNTSTKSQTITVQDNTAPVISTVPGPSTIECPATPVFANPTATDACDPNPSITHNDVTTPGTCAQEYTVTRTWTATDACGNTSTKSQTITVQDNTAPVISTVPGPSTIECPATPVFANPTATDACDPNPSITHNDVTTPGTCAQEYTVTRTWTATDACGNTSTKSQTITVQDNTAPVISNVPGPSTIECPATPVFANPTATDACDPNPTITHNDVTTPGTCAQEYTVTRTWTATDACGNTSTKSQTITVQDNTAPVISCPSGSPFARNTDLNACTYRIQGTEFDATATDACSASTLSWNVTGATTNSGIGSMANVLLNKGTNTIQWTATDACGNTSTCTITVNVSDNRNPTITCPAGSPFTRNANHAGCSYQVVGNEFDATFTDNCPGGSITNNFNNSSTLAGAILPSGSTTIVWTATDASGNSSTCSITVIVGTNLTSTCTNTNNELYFGYPGDQSSTFTVTPTGGTGPYIVVITMNRALLCNQVNASGDETWTAPGMTSTGNVCPSSGPGSTPVSTGTGTGPFSVIVTLMADATITATITDANGCVTTCSKFIHAEDVRCFAGNSGIAKVTICHQTGSSNKPCIKICVDEDAVSAHLAHGDFVGNCTPNCQAPQQTTRSFMDLTAMPHVDELTIKAVPNPSEGYFTLNVASHKDQAVEVRVFDIVGRQVYMTQGPANQAYRFGDAFKAGAYLVEVTQGIDRKVLKLIKQ